MNGISVSPRYLEETKRLEFACPEKKIDIAYRILNQDSSCLDKLEYYILKYFTRSWIVVKNLDENNAGHEAMFNINSVAQRTGLTRKVIKAENKLGNLFTTISDQLRKLVAEAELTGEERKQTLVLCGSTDQLVKVQEQAEDHEVSSKSANGSESSESESTSEAKEEVKEQAEVRSGSASESESSSEAEEEVKEAEAKEEAKVSDSNSGSKSTSGSESGSESESVAKIKEKIKEQSEVKENKAEETNVEENKAEENKAEENDGSSSSGEYSLEEEAKLALSILGKDSSDESNVATETV